jgi:hypothetical protein
MRIGNAATALKHDVYAIGVLNIAAAVAEHSWFANLSASLWGAS